MAKKATKAKTAKAAPAKKPAKRYKATPEGTSDRQHLQSIIQTNTSCKAKAAKETLDDIIGTVTTSLTRIRHQDFFRAKFPSIFPCWGVIPTRFF